MSSTSLCSFDKTSLRNSFIRQIAFGLGIPVYRVDCNASFIQNGGDSISAIKVVASCRSFGISITVSMIMSPGSLRDIIHALEYHLKSDCIRMYWTVDAVEFDESGLDLHAPNDSSLLDDAIRHPELQHSQATDTQLSLIHGSNSVAGRNIIRYCEVYETSQIPRVKQAWSTIISLEPIFRTRFEIAGDTYGLVQGNDAAFIWDEETVFDRKSYMTASMQLDCSTDFIGSKFKVIHLEQTGQPEESTVVWIIHHALVDAYSTMLLLSKHRDLLNGGNMEPGPSYTQFVRQISELQHTSQTISQPFWNDEIEKLDKARSKIQLPSPGLPPNPHYASKSWKLQVSQDELTESAKRNGVTVASIFAAAWALTLRRYVDSAHVSFGLILSGRSLPLPNAMSVIGPLINTVPFQVSLDQSQSVHDYLDGVFKHSLKLDELQWTLPGERIDKLFATTLNIQFEPSSPQKQPPGLIGHPYSYHESAVPMLVEVLSHGHVRILYHEHEYYSTDIDRLGLMFAKAVRFLTVKDLTVGQCCDALIEEDISQLWRNGNCCSQQTSPGVWRESLGDLFDHTAQTYPNLTALEKGSEKVTFLKLREMAQSVARFLTGHIEPGDIVCLHADQSINWIIAIYGILKAGGVYCPLDASLPAHLRAQTFHQSGSSIFLCGDVAQKGYRPDASNLCFSIDDILVAETGLIITEELPTINPSAPAYLCFTSGSTGTPKGIMCTHQSLVAFQKDFDVRLRSRPGWRISQLMSPAFDGSIHEIFSALSYGSTLVLQSSSDPFAHLTNVDSIILTPSIARVLEPKSFPRLKTIYMVGEVVPQAVCDKWAATVTAYNMYGPTEATCGATIKRLELGKPVTLGNPNPSTRIYILNSLQELVPPGVTGELYLAGVQVSMGYVNNAKENSKRFLEDHVYGDFQQRMYRTGDRGYWDENGELRFCGRNDRQVKLRGFRIDLDDIEVRIRDSIPGCTAVAVTQKQRDLIAVLQPKGLDLKNARRLLSTSLPAYAMPRHIAAVEEFPRTKAGKLDYGIITELVHPGPDEIANNYNVRLLKDATQVWKQVLGDENMELHPSSNFFELGGHSLSQIEVATKLSRLLGFSVPLSTVIQSPTLGDLVQRMEQSSQCVDLPLQRAQDMTSVSPIEKSWYRKYIYTKETSCFNVSMYFDLGPEVDVDKLTDAWNHVLGHHDILRCNFEAGSDGTLGKVISSNPSKVVRLEKLDVQSEVNKPFDLARNHLFRVTIVPGALLIVASHIICDYLSLNTILKEVGSRYLHPNQQPSMTPTSTIGLATQVHDRDLHFWAEYLSKLPKPSYSVGNWKLRNTYSGTSRVCQIPTDLFSRLRQFVSSRTMTAHQVCLAAVSLALQHHTDGIDLTLGAPHLGRYGTEAQTALGLFLQPMVIRVQYPPHGTSSEPEGDFLREVQRASQSALSHAVPWDCLLSSLDLVEELPDTSLFDVMVSYHEGFGKTTIPGVDARPRYTWAEGAKFKLMVEFTVANQEALLMRLEYGHECFSVADIGLMERLIVGALEMVVQGQSLGEAKRALSRIRYEGGRKDSFASSDLFGVRLDKV